MTDVVVELCYPYPCVRMYIYTYIYAYIYAYIYIYIYVVNREVLCVFSLSKLSSVCAVGLGVTGYQAM
jgi:hypothetical protein